MTTGDGHPSPDGNRWGAVPEASLPWECGASARLGARKGCFGKRLEQDLPQHSLKRGADDC